MSSASRYRAAMARSGVGSETVRSSSSTSRFRRQELGLGRPPGDPDRFFQAWAEAVGDAGQVGQVVDEQELGAAELDLVAGVEGLVAANGLAVDLGAVEAVEVADVPGALGVGELGVVAGGEVVGQDDAVLGRTADPVRDPLLEGIDVAEPVVACLATR